MRKLPKKWCIRQNAHENSCDWFNKKYNISAHLSGEYNYLCNYPNKKAPYEEQIPLDFTEITYEEFEYHILNKPQIKSEPEDLTFLKDLLIQNGIN